MFKKKKKSDIKDTPSMCLYCENATAISDDDNILCSFKGIVNKEYKCKKFIYDPLKRVPSPMPPIHKLSEEDMII
jgi:hypothetical protein